MNTMVKSTDDIIKHIYQRFSAQGWIAALSALAMGMFTHLFILTNELFNHDDLNSTFTTGGARTLRWLQAIFTDFVSPWGAPVLTGGLTIALIAVSALLVADTLQVRMKTTAALIGGIMVTSPVVASFLSYVEGSYLFVIGLPLAVLAVRWYEKGIKGYIASVLALGVSIAGYQSMMAVVVALIYIQLTGRLFSEECRMKKWFASLGKAVLLLFLGLVVWVISTHLIIYTPFGEAGKELSLGMTGQELETYGYAAQKESGVLYFSNILETFIGSVKQFIKYHFNIFFGGPNRSPVSRYSVYANMLIVAGMGVSAAFSVVKKKEWLRRMMLVLCMLVSPVCLNVTEVLLNGKAAASLQMMYSIVFTMVFVLCILEKETGLNLRWKNLVTNITVLAILVNIYCNIQIVNDAYMRMYSIAQASYSELVRIIDRVEQLPEWQAGARKIYFDFGEGGGYLINENYQAFTHMDDYIDMGWLGVMGTGVYKFYGHGLVSKYLTQYFGLVHEQPTKEEIQAIKKSKQYDTLEIFPSENAVQVINGIVVVKMDDTVQ